MYNGLMNRNLFNNKVKVAISDLTDGNMRFFSGDEQQIIENQAKLCKTINSDETARIRTVYGERKVFTEYTEISKKNIDQYSIKNPENIIPTSDGLVTKDSQIGLLLPLADCLGIVVYDSEKEIVGLLHSGRQNLEQDGPKKFIELLKANYGCNPVNLQVYFSPYALDYRITKLNDAGLAEAARAQLMEAGVLPENILDSKTDTVTSSNLPSYSHGDKQLRFAIVVKKA